MTRQVPGSDDRSRLKGEIDVQFSDSVGRMREVVASQAITGICQKCSTCAWVCSGEPELSIITSARLRVSRPRDSWAASRAGKLRLAPTARPSPGQPQLAAVGIDKHHLSHNRVPARLQQHGASSTTARPDPAGPARRCCLAAIRPISRMGQIVPSTLGSRGPSGGGANTIAASRAVDPAVGTEDAVAPALPGGLLPPPAAASTSWPARSASSTTGPQPAKLLGHQALARWRRRRVGR